MQSKLVTPEVLQTTMVLRCSWREGRKRRDDRWGIGEGTGRKPSLFSYLRWNDGGEKPSPFPHSMRMGNNGMHPERWDAHGPTERCLVRQDVAWVWPTTTAWPGARNKAPPRTGGSPPSQAGLGKTQTTRSPPGETIGLPKVDRMAQKNAPRDR